jgi:hypothetical protein
LRICRPVKRTRTGVVAPGGARKEEASVAQRDAAPEDRHTAALISGLVLGGLAGLGIAWWKAPMSGAQLRAKLAEQAEHVLFKMTGMDEWQPTEPVTVGPAAAAASSPAPPGVPATQATPRAEAVTSDQEETGAALPPTFRGEPLAERPKIEPERSPAMATEHLPQPADE